MSQVLSVSPIFKKRHGPSLHVIDVLNQFKRSMLHVYAHRHAGGPRACSGLNEMKIKYAHIEPLWLS